MVMTRTEFIDYLQDTLIPDLLASGLDATAADFRAALLFMEGAKVVNIDGDNVVQID